MPKSLVLSQRCELCVYKEKDKILLLNFCGLIATQNSKISDVLCCAMHFYGIFVRKTKTRILCRSPLQIAYQNDKAYSIILCSGSQKYGHFFLLSRVYCILYIIICENRSGLSSLQNHPSFILYSRNRFFCRF